MKIKQIMLKPVFIPENYTKKEVFTFIRRHKTTDLFIVVNKSLKFIGDIHINDIFLMLIPNEKFNDISVDVAYNLEKKFFANKIKDMIRKHEFFCNEDEDIIDVSIRLAGLEINEMPVLDEKKKVVGYITEGILARYLKND